MEGDVDSWGEGGTEEGASNGMSGRQVCVCVCVPAWAMGSQPLQPGLRACGLQAHPPSWSDVAGGAF